MYWLIGFNLVIGLAFLAARGLLPMKFLSGLIEGFHATIGISPPTEKHSAGWSLPGSLPF